MASSFHKRRNRSGLVGSWLRRLFLSGGAPDKTDAGRRRRSGRGERPLTFEACEDRRLLAIGVDWTAPTLTLTGTPGADQVTVVGSSSYVDVYANGSFQTRLTTANSGNVSTISFTGGALNDSLSVQNIQPSGTLAVTLTSAESLSMTKSKNVTVTSDGALSLGTTSVIGTLGVTTSGALTQSGAVVVAGTTTLDAGAGNDITLANAANNFSTVVITSGRDVSLRDVNSLILDTSHVSGNFSVQANMSSSKGTLTETPTAVLTVDGNTTLTVGSGSTITLNSANAFGNDAADTLAVTAATATINNTSATGTNFGNVSVSGKLTVTATAGNVTQAPGTVMVVRGVASFADSAVAPNGDITLANAGNNFATVTIPTADDVSLRDTNALILGVVNSGTLSVKTDGAITQTGALNVPTLVTLDAGVSSDITLTKSTNNSASFEIVSGRNVALRNSGGVAFDGSATSTVSGALTVTAGGDITQNQAVTVVGPTTLKATGADISLNNAGNDFSTVSVASAASLDIQDAGALVLGALKLTGATAPLTIKTGGDLMQSGAIVAKSGTTDLTATAGSITLDHASNDFGTVTVDASTVAVPGQNVTLRDTNAMVLGAFSVSGDLELRANLNTSKKIALSQLTAVPQPVLDVAGTTTLTVGPASTILLTKNNTMGGGVSVTAAADATLTNTPAIELGASKVAGNLTVVVTTPTAGADVVTQVAGESLVVGKTATFTASTGSDIVLDDSGNDFRTVAVTAARNVDLVDANAVILGAFATSGTPIAGAVGVTTDGAVTQSAALYVTGATTLDSSELNDIVLTNSSNDFSFVGITAARNVQLADANNIGLNASTISGNLTVTATGAVTQSAAVEVTNATTLSAASVDLSTNGTNNDFNQVAVTATGAVQLTNKTALILGTSAVGGALTITATAGLSQSGGVVVTGTTTLTTDATTPAGIALDLASNDFSTVTIGDALDVALRDKNALILGGTTGTQDITGTLSATAGGAITQTGVLTVGGDATFATVTSADVNLGTSANAFSGAVGVNSGNNVTLRDVDALRLGKTENISSLNITAGGSLTQGDAVAVTGTTTVDVGGGNDVTLSNTTNDFATVVIANARDVTITDANALDLGASTVARDLTVTAGADLAATTGEITDSGTVNVTGDVALTAGNVLVPDGAFNITLDTANYTGAVSLSGNTVTLTNARDTIFGDATVLADLTVSATGSFTNLLGPGPVNGAIKVSGLTSLSATTTLDLYTLGCVFAEWPGDASDLILDAPIVRINGNQSPVLAGMEVGALTYGIAANGNGTTAIPITGAITVTDADTVNMTGAVIKITGNYNSGFDVLEFANQNGITGSWDAGTGTMTLSGSASATNYQTALRDVKFRTTQVGTSPRTVSFTVDDGTSPSNTATRDITVQA
jgi:hypothetical protein